MGVGRILEFLGQLIDVFCKFFHIDMKNIADLQKIAETVRALIDQVGQQLSQLFGRLALTGMLLTESPPVKVLDSSH